MKNPTLRVSMNSDRIKELREQVVSSYDFKNSHVVYKLVIEIADYLLFNKIKTNISESKIPIGWLNPQEFVKLYPIFHPSELSKFNRYADDLKDNFKKIGRRIYCEPIPVLLFFMKNQKKLPKIYNRMKKHNFFGLKLDDQAK